MKKGDLHTTYKSFAAFLVLLLAASILLMFLYNQDIIMSNGNTKTFLLLAIAGCGFLIGLLYLIGQPHTTPKRRKKSR